MVKMKSIPVLNILFGVKDRSALVKWHIHEFLFWTVVPTPCNNFLTLHDYHPTLREQHFNLSWHLHVAWVTNTNLSSLAKGGQAHCPPSAY